jgi:monofunctional glycosyltransferase
MRFQKDPDPDETLLQPHPTGRAEAPPPPPPPPRVRGRAWRVARRLLQAGLWIFAGTWLLFALLLVVYRFADPPTTGVQAQRRIEAALAGRGYEKRHDPVPIADLPRHVPRAVVAAEDGRFYDHHGFDLGAMREAAREAAAGGRMRGASTITQQLVKNLFGCACRSPVRKLYEVTLTPVAELALGKERILELYLSQVEWGDGVFGIEAGARHHYGVGAARLPRTQAAGMAALLPNPRARTPGNTSEYRRAILRRMEARGW